MNYRDIYELTLVTAILQRSTEAERRAGNPELPFRFSGLCTPVLPKGFIFASGALLRVQGGGTWLSSGSWNNEDVQNADRNNWVA